MITTAYCLWNSWGKPVRRSAAVYDGVGAAGWNTERKRAGKAGKEDRIFSFSAMNRNNVLCLLNRYEGRITHVES